MDISNNGLELIAELEGCILHPYKDSLGIPTIGIGATHYQDGKSVTMSDPAITKEQAYYLLKFWAKNKVHGVSNIITSEVNQNQFDSLVSFCYNGGVGMLQKSHLLVLVNENPNNPSIADEFRKFVYGHDAHGQAIMIKGLVNRREKEIALYFKQP